MKIHTYAILVLVACSAGCRKETVVIPPMRYDTAVVHIVGHGSSRSPVSKNYGVNPDGTVTGYGSRIQINDLIEVKYDFIGRCEYPVTGRNPHEWGEGDVYLFSILIGTETIIEPVVFRGENLEVYKGHEFEITIKPANQNVDPTRTTPAD